MTPPVPAAGGARRPGPATWVCLALAVVLAVQFYEALTWAANWDEFWHYNHIREFDAGTLTRTLQSLHARIFAWTLRMPGDGIDHIQTIRVFMFGCELATIAAIAAIAARFTDRLTGLICALAYITFPFVFDHGASFRYDSPSAALMMGALWVLLCTRLEAKTIALGAVLVGLAPLVSIKTVLYAPAFLGIAWLRWQEEGRSPAFLIRGTIMGLAALGAFALFYWWHSHGIAAGETADESFVSGSAARMLALEAKPYWGVALHAALIAPAHAALMLIFPALLYKSALPRADKIALAGLFLPLASLAFYHNTAPYYYVFMLPPVLAACSLSVACLTRRLSPGLLTGVLAVTALIAVAAEGENPVAKQHEMQRVATELFPPETRYFDYPGFLTGLDKANPFMSLVVTRDYLDRNIPVIREAMLQAPVPLVMENDPVFSLVLTTTQPATMWHPADVAAVRGNYIRFWGPLWIAGKEVPASGQPVDYDLLVPGSFTIEGAPLVIDGAPHATGATVILERGRHRLSAPQGRARLVWGDHLVPPAGPAPEMPYYKSFR